MFAMVACSLWGLDLVLVVDVCLLLVGVFCLVSFTCVSLGLFGGLLYF